ncbi:NAD(P)H-dependent oxidoreductase [Butyrivibrio sp. VCD2006]|uniref:NAD(P)H-dependent oxidoreductase n=1 Tax=Butyrivibrio sp. VCD2006 TaxID=1280664 RepID=UPI00040CBCD7|nr:NAD(P)H-dependent oxidoreductase [Butyrivibrio sp. VCD2006]
MKILVINGSPKGESSITYQTMLYIEAFFEKHDYKVIHAGEKIKHLEKDFQGAEEMLKWADLLVFCYPVYTFLVPSQLHRFIEIVKEKKIDLSGKYATQISTSKHFYDTTAHEFIRENCLDLGLSYIRGLAADMDDLLKKKGQYEAKAFFKHILWSVKNDHAEISAKHENTDPLFTATHGNHPAPEVKDQHIALVTDCGEDDIVLKSMIDRFKETVPYHVDIVNLKDFNFYGGCLGCFNCAASGECIYKDGFDVFLRDKIQTSAATIYAFRIKDHSMGYRFKLYDDRQFCNGHRTVTMGKPVGYLIDGHLSCENNLKTLIEGRSQVGGNPLAGVVSNEKDVDRQIDILCSELDYLLTNKYIQPANFYGVGGMKIFRDLIYKMQGMMREDHRFYKEHGFYDFPQKDKVTILGMYLVGAMMKSGFAKKNTGKMTQGMLMPYKEVIDSAKKRT